MNRLIFIASLFSSFAFAQFGQDLKIKKEMLNFTYSSFDGFTNYKCEHVIENEAAQDWKIECKENGVLKKSFSVHLWVTAYIKELAPKLSYEILYWVTDRTTQKLSGHSSTHWIKLKEPSELHSLNLSQGVDEDTAGLYLEITF